jgi:hypothetical protein
MPRQGKAPIGSGINHAWRPSINKLLGEQVTVTHHDPDKHGTWEGELEGHYNNGVEKAENFVFKVEGTPCRFCKKRCTDGEAQGCAKWQKYAKAEALDERYAHSGQPTLFFTPHTVFSVAGTRIVLG